MRAHPRVLVGTHTYRGSADAMRRQSAALETLLTLEGVAVVDVQFAEGDYRHDRLDTLAVLRQDALTVSGRQGARKPIVPEVLDAICAEADRRRLPVFCFTNADIYLSQETVDLTARGDYDAVVFSREDYDGATGQPCGLQIAGADLFAFRTGWWRRHRHRFRPYILGEPVWDNVFTAVAMCHGHGVIENRRPLVRHERHEMGWAPGGGPYGAYTRLLAGLDTWYFDRWCKYVAGIVQLREAGTGVEREQALAREIFRWPPSLPDRLLQAARSAKARLRYEASRRRRGT